MKFTHSLSVSVISSSYCAVVFLSGNIIQRVHHFSVFGDLGCFYFFLFTNKASINNLCNCFCRLMLSFLMGIYLDVLLLDYKVGIGLTL